MRRLMDATFYTGGGKKWQKIQDPSRS